MTGLQIGRRALRLIGAIYPGQSITAAEEADVKEALQGLIDTWRTQRLVAWYLEELQETLVSGQQDYTIGTGGFFNTPRPLWIYAASCIDNNNPTQPLELPVELITPQKWQQIPQKNVQSSLFQGVYYDKDFPLGTLKIFPIVNVGTVEMKLYLPNALTGFATMSTVYTFPPGYEEAIVYNLALRLAPEWGQPIPEIVATMAKELLGNIKRTNIILEELAVDDALRWSHTGFYNWRTDTTG